MIGFDKMNEIDKRFLLNLAEQLGQLVVTLNENKKQQAAVDEKYRLLAEQEKKNLKIDEGVYIKMIEAIDTSTVNMYGKTVTELTGFSENPDQFELKNEQPATFEESIRVPETDDLSELEALKKKLEEADKNDSGDDFDVDKAPAPEVENPQPEPEAEEEAEANEEVEQIAETIEDNDDWGDDSDSKENDPFGSFEDWPDVDEQFK